MTDGATNTFPTGNLAELDLSKFRIPQEHFSEARASKVLTTVPVGRPPKDSFFRTHPDSEYRASTGLIKLDSTGEVYVVPASLCRSLEDEPAFRYFHLVTAVTHNGNVYLWPVDAVGTHTWGESAREAAELAKTTWIRLKSNREAGAYDAMAASGDLGEPMWPAEPFEKLLTMAFRGRVVDSLDHPILRKLRGE